MGWEGENSAKNMDSTIKSYMDNSGFENSGATSKKTDRLHLPNIDVSLSQAPVIMHSFGHRQKFQPFKPPVQSPMSMNSNIIFPSIKSPMS